MRSDIEAMLLANRSAVRRLLSLLLALPLLAWAEPRAEASAVGWSDLLSGEERALLALTNDYRAAQGLPRLRPDPGLQALARGASDAMARARHASHAGFRDRFELSGAHLCVENIARGRMAPELAIGLWRQSPSHHRNLLEARALGRCREHRGLHDDVCLRSALGTHPSAVVGVVRARTTGLCHAHFEVST